MEMTMVAGGGVGDGGGGGDGDLVMRWLGFGSVFGSDSGDGRWFGSDSGGGASIEQLKNRAARKEAKGPDKVPSSSNQDNQSGKSSGTERPSDNNSNDQDGSPRFNSNLLSMSNKEIRNNIRKVAGLLVDLESKQGSPTSGQSESAKYQTSELRADFQSEEILKQLEGREMEMINFENTNYHVQTAHIDISENESNSSKEGIRKWKRIARAKHQLPDHITNSLSYLQLTSQNQTGGYQIDRSMEQRDCQGSESLEFPCNYGTDGSGKRKVVSISPSDFPDTKKKKDIDSTESTLLTAEPGSQAHRDQ
ncbi:hypothetical protein LWI29_004504 [Acer saccharum]|uniref:Uncharacterized protein n=1 Tax=Acer saccharum TaxID=4024 RepID=A0AA39VWP6_ACESA|nr:hypothetical protein LWI29_004504 [Acer saccharum]